MDGAAPDTRLNAQRKAYTAARSDARTTRELAEKVRDDAVERASFDPFFTFFSGGSCVFEGDVRIGAVGVSGLPGAVDEELAERATSLRPLEVAGQIGGRCRRGDQVLARNQQCLQLAAAVVRDAIPATARSPRDGCACRRRWRRRSPPGRGGRARARSRVDRRTARPRARPGPTRCSGRARRARSGGSRRGRAPSRCMAPRARRRGRATRPPGSRRRPRRSRSRRPAPPGARRGRTGAAGAAWAIRSGSPLPQQGRRPRSPGSLDE